MNKNKNRKQRALIVPLIQITIYDIIEQREKKWEQYLKQYYTY
ncbi:MAG: hypothetical protein [Microvirus sp.]|nr:MAG: hypothetical protein [Microvirus sp.]